MAFLHNLLIMLYNMVHFVFGQWHPLTGTILIFLVINLSWDLVYKRDNLKQVFVDITKKASAYTTFFAMAHQFDRLVMNSLLEFPDATQFFVALYTLIGEVKLIFSSLKIIGIEVPWILISRLKMLEQYNEQPDPEGLEEQIRELRKSIEQLKELQKQGEQKEDGAGGSDMEQERGDNK